ncbi:MULTISPECIES: CHAT domain-containing protein [Streptomyces]|uniref:CHAT domain-containing protein n=1 Tax=Streptomyces eurythermus TaxID=42237 RepID=A0ABW6Z925_9ACTN|nr:CHAT domain-containing protein [Streptomyces sp. DSM 40868]QIS75533.1 CHAT domain-containing protein [Streptomyces sp. DSM 40868]
MRRTEHEMVAEFVERVRAALSSGNPDDLFDRKLDKAFLRALRRARRSRSLCAMTFESMAVLDRERAQESAGPPADALHDVALLFSHTRYAPDPLGLVAEADVLLGGRHRPSARRRPFDRRPFTQYLFAKRDLIRLRGGEVGEDVLQDARSLAAGLRDPYLKADIDDFLRSLGEKPPPGPQPREETLPMVPPPTAFAQPPGSAGARELRRRAERALRDAARHEGVFHRTKDPDALDEALKATAQAAWCWEAAGEYEFALRDQMDVGRLYSTRFALLGIWSDYEQAVARMRRVVDALLPDHPAVFGNLLQLAVTLEGGQQYLIDKFGPRCGTEQVDAAIADLRLALLGVEAGVAPPDDEDLPGTLLTVLGHCLLMRCLVRFATEADSGTAGSELAEAEEALDRAAALLGDCGDGGGAPDVPLRGGRDQPTRAQVVTILRVYRVQARLLRALVESDVAAARELIAVVRERIAAGKDPQTRAQWQAVLGGAYALAGRTTGKDATVYAGIEALEEATRGGTGSEGPQHTLRTARLAATLAMGERQWAAAEQALGEALRQIHALRAHGIPEATRRAWLQQGRGLLGDLVTCLVALDRAEEATVAFEEHRAVLLSEVLGDRADIIGLEQVAPALARDYRTASRELHRFDGSAEARRGDHRSARRGLLDDRERVARRIRKVPGFERFGLPPHFAELAVGAGEGPVVLLNTGSLRGDALVLRDGEVTVVPLPEARADRLDSAAADLHRALDAADGARVEGDHGAYVRGQRAVAAVLEQLWDWVAAPVWDRAMADQSAPAHGQPREGRGAAPGRLWWVPSGSLWFLPLHAAGAPGGPSLTDLAVSSYAPTVRMLRAGRQRPPGRVRDPLVVSVPHAPRAASVPGAAAEARLLTDLLPGTRVLAGREATRSAVLGALGRHPCLHFAGHGRNTPDGTVLVLHDHEANPLLAQDVLHEDVPGGELAYLSACEAAQTSLLLPDEATHFGAALSVAGYRHVVGTLWRVDDGVAVEAARRFYGRLTATTTDPALALHHTVRELRNAYPSMPGLWAAHIHIGP